MSWGVNQFKLIQVVFTSEFHEYWGHEVLKLYFVVNQFKFLKSPKYPFFNNLKFWSKLFIHYFWVSHFLMLLRPCRNARNWFWKHQYSWNSEVETTWISLIGWPLRTSTTYILVRYARYAYNVVNKLSISISVSFSDLPNFRGLTDPSVPPPALP